MLKRIITGAVLIAVSGVAIWLKGWLLRGALLAAMALSMHEIYQALRSSGRRPVTWVGYVYCALAVGLQALRGELPGKLALLESLSPAGLSLALGAMLGMCAVVLRGRVDFENMAATVFPMVYPGLFFAMIFSLQDLNNPQAATLALVLTLFIASVGDAFALFTGVRFGKHKLSPEISPHKTVEGALGGLAASVLFALLAAFIADRAAPGIFPPTWLFGLLGLAAGGLSQLGDLTASLIKRHCGVKDFGTIFPGHGGMLDRTDGILFCGAVCAIFFHGLGL